MKQRLEQLFMGRQGMDELSKYLFWSSLGFFAGSVLFSVLNIRFLSSLSLWFAVFFFLFSFVRAFSRDLARREAENMAFLRLQQQKKEKRRAAADRHAQRKDYKFFECPSCRTMIRVPRGKGKIHIRCKCGYTLYRKT